MAEVAQCLGFSFFLNMFGADVDWTNLDHTDCMHLYAMYIQQFAGIVFDSTQESMCIAGFSSLARTRDGTGSTFS